MQNIESDNKLVFELNIKFQMKDYLLKLATKKGFIVTMIVVALKIIIYTLFRSSS